MAMERVSSYVEGSLQIEDCRSDILKRMERVKQKIDAIEKEQKLHPEDQAEDFVNRFGKELKFLLRELQLFQKVVNKLEKEMYERHEPGKKVLITTIRQQIRRFHSLIPENIQEELSKLKIKRSGLRGQVPSIIEDDQVPIAPKTEEVLVKKESEQSNQSDQMSKSGTIVTEQQSQQLLKNLEQFLLLEQETPRPPEDDSYAETRPSIENLRESQSGNESQTAEQFEELQKLERNRYKKFIYLEQIKKKYSHLKTAGKVFLCVLVLAFLLLVLATFTVYKVVKSIAGEL